jgi:AbrB family looped-hinge helix DNA binding protein
MAAKRGEKACCPGDSARCRVETLVSVDERGQMVLPKDFRERAGIGAGEKLVLISLERNGEVCCMVLMKAEELGDLVKEKLGPVLGNLA